MAPFSYTMNCNFLWAHNIKSEFRILFICVLCASLVLRERNGIENHNIYCKSHLIYWGCVNYFVETLFSTEWHLDFLVFSTAVPNYMWMWCAQTFARVNEQMQNRRIIAGGKSLIGFRNGLVEWAIERCFCAEWTSRTHCRLSSTWTSSSLYVGSSSNFFKSIHRINSV